MKILHVYKTYLTESFGGVEQLLAQLTDGMKSLGVESRILCLSKNPNPPILDNPEAQIFRYQQLFELASTGFSITAIKGFQQLAQWADIIHYQYPWPFGDLLHFLAKHKKPTVVTYQSDIVRQKGLLTLYRPLQKLFLNSVDRIVATSPKYIESSEVLKNYSAKISAIPLGLNQSYYPAPLAKDLSTWQARLPNKFLLFIGVLRYYKGLMTLLDAAHHHQVATVIIGSGPLEAELKQRIAQENLNHVTLLGKVSESDKIALLQLCQGVVLPSHLRSEAYGLALVEGAMFSKTLISCEIGTGTSFINIDQQTGLVVPPENAVALAKAMQAIIDNPEKSRFFGQQAYQRYLQLFTAEKMCQQYVKFYQDLLTRFT